MVRLISVAREGRGLSGVYVVLDFVNDHADEGVQDKEVLDSC
jgi:hypothetical protein